MIQIVKTGQFHMFESVGGTRLLCLEEVSYVWLNLAKIGQILELSRSLHHPLLELDRGKFRMYRTKVAGSGKLIYHLEILGRSKKWQCYILPSGLPTEVKKRVRIWETSESYSSPLSTPAVVARY
ncbi:MAG: hypothetical protein ACHQUB_00100 [Candidatus Saccharimonadia bacterium]